MPEALVERHADAVQLDGGCGPPRTLSVGFSDWLQRQLQWRCLMPVARTVVQNPRRLNTLGSVRLAARSRNLELMSKEVCSVLLGAGSVSAGLVKSVDASELWLCCWSCLMSI